jgi:hypothetical protein
MVGETRDVPSLANPPRAPKDASPAAGPEAGARRPALCGDLGIRIDRNGTWYYQNSPIGRIELVRLFASVLKRGEDGGYWLVTPAEMGRIEVEDAPFLAVELSVAGHGRSQALSLRTNIDETVVLDSAHPLRIAVNAATGEPAPYVTLREGIEARIARSVYYELVDLGVEERFGSDHIYGIWSRDAFFPLGRLDGKP